MPQAKCPYAFYLRSAFFDNRGSKRDIAVFQFITRENAGVFACSDCGRVSFVAVYGKPFRNGCYEKADICAEPYFKYDKNAYFRLCKAEYAPNIYV